MTRGHYFSSSSFILVLLASVFLTSCATTSNQKFGMSFLPPAPRTAAIVDTAAEAPKVDSTLYVSETPGLLTHKSELPPRPSVADMRIRKADEHFQAGKQFYETGEFDAARKEFDAAIDALLGAPENLPERAKVEKRLEELTASIFRYDVNGMGLADLARQPDYDKAPLEDILDMTFPVDPSLKPIVKEQLAGTTSQLPLVVNDTVLGYINFFQSDRGHRTLVSGLKRAGRYKALIQKTLAEEGVPEELIFLAQAESGFLPRAVSRRSAAGMWQFVSWRGKQYGLEQSASFDDRLDPEKATRSAARHLKDLYAQFGDWYLSMAAYNCGPGCVDKAVQRTGYADFWELRSRNAIPRETSNYVPIILAMTIMAKNPKAYGLEDIDVEPAVEFDTFAMTAPTHLALVADLVDRPVPELRELNPALLRNVAPAGYELKVPKGTQPMLEAGLAAVPAPRRASCRVHRISSGETLTSIAKQYRVSVATLSAANGGGSVNAGDLLLVPTTPEPERPAASSRSHGKTASRQVPHSSKSKAQATAKKTPPHRSTVQRASVR